jgi:hypothetical protein
LKFGEVEERYVYVIAKAAATLMGGGERIPYFYVS